MIVDTNIFIDYLRGKEEAKQFLNENNSLTTSAGVLSEMIYGFYNKREVKRFEKLLVVLGIEVVSINSEMSDKGIELFKEYFFGKDVGFIDCLIAATALELDKPLVTLNLKHFRFIKGLDVVKPY